MPSKAAIDQKEPCLGRIWADSIAPPVPPPSNYAFRGWTECQHLPLIFFADISCDSPLNEGHISILRTNGTGLSQNEPMAIVQVENPSIPDGRYIVKNRAADIFFGTWGTIPSGRSICVPLQ